MRTFIQTALIMVLMVLSVLNGFAQDWDTGINNIHQKVENINQNMDLTILTLKNKEFMEVMTDGGGQLTGFINNDTICKVHERIVTSFGILTTEYYFCNEQLFYVLEKEDTFPFNISLSIIDNTRTENTFEGRYYFNSGKLFETKINGKKRVPDELIYGTQTKAIQLETSAKHWVALLTTRSKNSIQYSSGNQLTQSLTGTANSGDNLSLSEFTDPRVDLKAQYMETGKDFSREEEKWKSSDSYDISNNMLGSGVQNIPETSSNSVQSNDQVRQILKSNIFVKISSITSMIIFTFDDTRFLFRVFAINGTELCRATGTYSITASIDGSIADILIFRMGGVQKSPYYADNGGIDTELLLLNNNELKLKYPSQELISYFGLMDLTMMSKEVPDYFLVGTDCFFAQKILK